MKNLIVLTLSVLSVTTFACSDILNSTLRILDSDAEQNLCEYSGNVILVVNVASKCGYTYQYEGLQALYDNYKDKGLVVVGIPSRDFLGQELADESDVKEFCSTEYGVTFPMFATTKVRGKKAHPFYKKLRKESGVQPSWNFNKYLISKDGSIVSTYGKNVEPNSPGLISDIEKLL